MKQILNSISKNQWVIFTVVSTLYVLPLLLVQDYFTDDMRRIISGMGWHHDGRFLSTHLMKSLSFFGDIFSLFPISTIVSALILTFCGYVITKTLNLEEEGSSVLTPYVLLTSPFLIENLLYRFDVFPMTLSLLSVIYPFVYLAHDKKFFLHSFLGLLCTLCLFQSGAMAYLSLCICLTLKFYFDGEVKKIGKLFVFAASAFILSFITYKIIVYFSGRSLPARSDIIVFESGFSHLLLDRINTVGAQLKSLVFDKKYFISWILFAVMSVLAIGVSVRKLNKGLTYKVLGIALIISSLLMLVFLITIPNILTRGPRWAARTYYAYPFIFYALLVFHKNLKWKRLARTSIVISLFFSFLLISQVSNALRNRADYTQFLLNQIVPHLIQNDVKRFVIAGDVPVPPRNKLIFENFKIAEFMLPSYEVEGLSWGQWSLNRYTNLSMTVDEEAQELVDQRCGFSLIESNQIFEVRKWMDAVVIDFDYRKCRESDQ